MSRHLVIIGLMLALPMTTQAQAERPVGVFVGGGVEALHLRDNTTFTPGLTVQAGFYLQPTGSRWGLRLMGTFYNRNGVRRTQSAGLALDATFDLARGGTRPYLLAGAGANWLYIAAPPRLPGEPRLEADDDWWSGSLGLGVGVRQRLAFVWLYAEARYTALTYGTGWGSAIVPLTLGLRF